MAKKPKKQASKPRIIEQEPVPPKSWTKTLMVIGALVLALSFALFFLLTSKSQISTKSPSIDKSIFAPSYNLVETYAVDGRYFYQGLEWLNETTLLVGEGWWGSSNLALMTLEGSRFIR